MYLRIYNRRPDISPYESLHRCWNCHTNVSLLHTIKMHDYTELTGTCTKREVSPLTKKQKIIFRSTDQKEYHFTFDKNIRLLSGHYYRLYFRNVANLSGEEKVTPDLLAYEELSSLNKSISSKNP